MANLLLGERLLWLGRPCA